MQTLPTIFTNQLLMAHLEAKNVSSQLQKPLNELTNHQLQEFIQQQMKNSEVKPAQMEEFTKTITSLNYSVDTNQIGEQQIPQFSTIQQQQESFEIMHSCSNTQLLSELLAHEEQQISKDNMSTVHNSQVIEEEQVNKICFEKHESEEEMADYSEELTSLKDKIVQIQGLAQQQIVRLKKELQHERSLKGDQQQKKAQMIDAAVNTEQDLRDQQIAMLKQSLLYHISLNKQLLSNELNQNSFSACPTSKMTKIKL